LLNEGATPVAEQRTRISGPLACGNVIDGDDPPGEYPPDSPFDPPVKPNNKPKPSTGVPYQVDDFEWDDESIVFEAQPRTAIYWNVHGNLVIRQRGDVYDDDPYVVICRNNLNEFIERIRDEIFMRNQEEARG
jgi:hypothetical protein